MSNCNEIIERLENLAKHAVHYVGEPPFVMSLDDGIALHDAINLLKEQEPRVMTSDEVGNIKRGDWVWIEISDSKLYPGGCLYYCEAAIDAETIEEPYKYTNIYFHSLAMVQRMDTNNAEYAWRCWTARPSDEQRKAVKWE